MTSGSFHIVPLGDITVKREERQRSDLPDIEVLADSIRRLGLIHPIVITRDLELVAGERRYAACSLLGWSTIPAQYVDEVDPKTLRAIELEENIKRKDISWQDQVRAVTEYHKFRMAEAPPDEWKQDDTARALGITQQHISRILLIGEELNSEKPNPLVVKAERFSTASGIVRRAAERKEEQLLNKLHESFGGVSLPEERPADSILTGDFTKWIDTDIVPRFNLVHCDFPYGIDADSFVQGAANTHGGYIDTKEVWEGLMEALTKATKRILAPSCHLMFWYAMRKGDTRLYEPTVRALERMGWDINPMPLIWVKSDGAGIIPDPERGPRQIYETCLFGCKGDRKIVRAVANAYSAPTVRERHMSEKPEPVLRHFFGMLVDKNSVVLDPTCGSGSAMRAAESLGAKYVFGVESNPDFADRAREALKRARSLKKAETVLQPKETTNG